jgi:hypothetical protein
MASIVACGLMVALSGCAPSLDRQGGDAVADRVVRAQERLQGMLASGLADAELLSEIAGNIEGDIRSVSRADIETGTSPNQGFYSFEDTAENVRVKFLIRAGVMSGGFTQQPRGFYTCVELRGSRADPKTTVTAHPEVCPDEFVDTFNLTLDTFVDATTIGFQPPK